MKTTYKILNLLHNHLCYFTKLIIKPYAIFFTYFLIGMLLAILILLSILLILLSIPFINDYIHIYFLFLSALKIQIYVYKQFINNFHSK